MTGRLSTTVPWRWNILPGVGCTHVGMCGHVCAVFLRPHGDYAIVARRPCTETGISGLARHGASDHKCPPSREFGDTGLPVPIMCPRHVPPWKPASL